MRLTKLTSRGISHIIVPLIFVVGFALVGSYLLVKSHASTAKYAPASCPFEGKYLGAGVKEYDCSVYKTTPVVDEYNHTVGTLSTGKHWITCQQKGSTLSDSSGDYNYWWGRTIATSNGAHGWINAVYASGGGDDGPFGSAPNCNGQNGVVPIQKTATTTSKYCGDPGINDSSFGSCQDPPSHNCGAHGQWKMNGASGCKCVDNYTGSACTTPPGSGGSTGGSDVSASARGLAVLAKAQTQIGKAYCWDGGTIYQATHGSGNDGHSGDCSSSSTVGFDCSGLVMYSVYQSLKISLTHSSPAQPGELASHGATRVTNGHYAKGDILFWYSPIDHVGIYAGNGQILDAYNFGAPVGYHSISSEGDSHGVVAAYRFN